MLCEPRAHSFGQFEKHALLKARNQSPCFSYPGLEQAFQSAGSADLSSFGGVGVGRPPDLPCCLPVYNQAKMAGLFANSRSHRLLITILYKIKLK